MSRLVPSLYLLPLSLSIAIFWSVMSNQLLTTKYFVQQQNSGRDELASIQVLTEQKKNDAQEEVSSIFHGDPFHDFRKELAWFPNRTLVPWEQMNRTAPCIITKNALDPKKQRTPSVRGLLYIKPEKAASSTMAGVAARMAYKLFDLTNTSTFVAEQGIKVKWPMCQVRLTHGWSDNRHHPATLSSRMRNESFLFTFLRNPGRRVLSAFYYFGFDARNNTGKEPEPTAKEVLDYLRTHVNGQYNKCMDKRQQRLHNGDSASPENYALHVQTIIEELDFIGIVERME